MEIATLVIVGVIVILALWILVSAVKIVRPTQRGLVERFGKYNRFAPPGMHFMLPFAEKMYLVNITEQMVDAEPQEIITNDNLNATVDAQVYFKVKDSEEDVKACLYNVRNYERQIVNLARTTLRNIIGTLTLRSANSERGRINTALYTTLFSETQRWGIEIVRTELKEINPPQDVQATMNKVVKAENEKIAAIDTATAAETEADGRRRAVIKLAEADKQSTILRAEGEAEAIKLVNEAADMYFKGNAQILRKLEAVEKSLSSNAKIVVPSGSSLVNVIGNLMGGDEKKAG
jgi:regulator of protease activity HflC (stomatin/prohibitin superfamily)